MERLLNMTDQANTAWVQNTTYGPANELLSMTANGFNETRGYNANLQLTELVSGANVHYKYNYSATQNNGQLLSQQDVVSGETVTYQYDSLKRLIQASGDAAAGAFVINNVLVPVVPPRRPRSRVATSSFARRSIFHGRHRRRLANRFFWCCVRLHPVRRGPCLRKS